MFNAPASARFARFVVCLLLHPKPPRCRRSRLCNFPASSRRLQTGMDKRRYHQYGVSYLYGGQDALTTCLDWRCSHAPLSRHSSFRCRRTSQGGGRNTGTATLSNCLLVSNSASGVRGLYVTTRRSPPVCQRACITHDVRHHRRQGVSRRRSGRGWCQQTLTTAAVTWVIVLWHSYGRARSMAGQIDHPIDVGATGWTSGVSVSL